MFHELRLDSRVRLFWLDGGGFRLDGGSLFGPVPRPRWAPLYPPADDNSVPLTAHVVLVECDRTWGLLDSGFGHHLSDRQRRAYTQERESQVEVSLSELGLSPARIDWIVLSHLHLDHAGGVLARDGERVRPVFPHAPIVVQAIEAREARDPTQRAQAMYTGDAFEHLDALGLVREVDGDSEVRPGVRVFLTGGHSRGHQGTLIEGSEGGALLHLGDVLVTHAHLAPPWVSALDDFPLDVIRVKRAWLPRAAAAGWWVALSHDVALRAVQLDADGRLARPWPS